MTRASKDRRVARCEENRFRISERDSGVGKGSSGVAAAQIGPVAGETRLLLEKRP
jgi:hypothetical protein